MFREAELFNQPIGGWSVDTVTDMRDMFRKAEAFNQPMGNWKVGNLIVILGPPCSFASESASAVASAAARRLAPCHYTHKLLGGTRNQVIDARRAPTTSERASVSHTLAYMLPTSPSSVTIYRNQKCSLCSLR